MGRHFIPKWKIFLGVFLMRLKRASAFYFMLTICLSLCLSFSSCGLFDPSHDGVVITVGKRAITGDELKKDIRRISSRLGIADQEVTQILKPLINRIINDYLVIEYGKAHGITISENELAGAIREIKRDYPDALFEEMLLQSYIDLDDWREELRRQLLIRKIMTEVTESITPITFEEIKTYFNFHKDEFKQPQMVRFRQIVTKTREEAEKILERLNKGDNLKELAKEYSLTTETQKGGEDGWVDRGSLEESMENVLFSLPIGKISPIVKTPYGYHIFQVLAKRPGGLKRLPEVMKEIELKLSNQKNESYYKKWLKELKEQFPVKINQEALNRLEFG